MDFISQISGMTGSFLTTLVSFLVVLTIVVFVHEFGHFWVGRRCGVGVTAFSIGFGPELFGWNDRHGTRWKISAIPLGGYVKFVGDVNAASVPDDEARQPHDARRAGGQLPAQEPRQARRGGRRRPDRQLPSRHRRSSPA